MWDATMQHAQKKASPQGGSDRADHIGGDPSVAEVHGIHTEKRGGLLRSIRPLNRKLGAGEQHAPTPSSCAEAHDLGAPQMEVAAKISAADRERLRLWAKIPTYLSPDECWPWQGALSDKGYGLHLLAGRQVVAHRLAWEFFHGRKTPEDLVACHACDFPPCCNPHHIWIAGGAANSQDASRKGLHIAHALLAQRQLGHWASDVQAIKLAKADAADVLERRRTGAWSPRFVDGKLAYGLWSGDRTGIPVDDRKCIAVRRTLVTEPDGLLFQCRRDATCGRLCKQHAQMPRWRAFVSFLSKIGK